MPYSPILLVHISAGILGLLSGTAAMFFRNGSPRHARAGRVFVVAMLTMASVAVYLAIVRHQPSNIGGGILTFYLIGTAWLTARRKDGETARFDWVVLLIPLALGILTWMNGLSIVRSAVDSPDGVPVGMTFFMGSVMLLAAAGDVACWSVEVLLEPSASRGISGACALGYSSLQDLFSWDPQIGHSDCCRRRASDNIYPRRYSARVCTYFLPLFR
jgi:uncharacterized membrane protein